MTQWIAKTVQSAVRMVIVPHWTAQTVQSDVRMIIVLHWSAHTVHSAVQMIIVPHWTAQTVQSAVWMIIVPHWTAQTVQSGVQIIIVLHWTAQTVQSDVRMIIVPHSRVHVSTSPRYQLGMEQTDHAHTWRNNKQMEQTTLYYVRIPWNYAISPPVNKPLTPQCTQLHVISVAPFPTIPHKGLPPLGPRLVHQNLGKTQHQNAWHQAWLSAITVSPLLLCKPSQAALITNEPW